MKKCSLKKTWEYCLAMWKWIAKEWQKGRRDISRLKEEWCIEHGFDDIDNDCFFCHYQMTHFQRKKFNIKPKSECPRCPGVEVAPQFDCYSSRWDTDPVKFYRILKRMYGRKKKLAGWK